MGGGHLGRGTERPGRGLVRKRREVGGGGVPEAAPRAAATRFRLTSGRSALCVQPETRCVGHQREDVNAHASCRKVCSFQLPKVCSFRLPLTHPSLARLPSPESASLAVFSITCSSFLYFPTPVRPVPRCVPRRQRPDCRGFPVPSFPPCTTAVHGASRALARPSHARVCLRTDGNDGAAAS